MEEDPRATLDSGNSLVYSEKEFAELVAKARAEEQAKAQRQLALAEVRRQYIEEAAATSKAHMEDIRWHEQKIQQLEQQLRDRDSVPAQNAFAQPLNEAAISALSIQQARQLYRLINSRVDNILQQYARGDSIDTTTGEEHHEASTEAPYSRVAPIRKKRGKKLVDGLKGLWKIFSFDDTLARIKGMSNSTLGLDKSSDDTAAMDKSSTSSPFKSSNMPSHGTLEPPTTPINRPSADTKPMRTQRKLGKKALRNVGPVQSRDAKEDGSMTETSLTDATARASPTPAERRQQRPLIDTMAHPRRDPGLARASQHAPGLPPTPDRGLQPQCSHAVLGSRRDGSPQQPRKRTLSDARFSFGGLASDPFQPSSATQQASLHRTIGRRGLSAETRQQVPTAGDQPAVQEGGRTTEVPDSEEDRYGSAMGSSPPRSPEDDMEF
ncbi:hypothetical protein LTS15_009364 [Exophiala xenobiotica]|nr:hypothetical protein LTS15_009364 [Exophiala xenobiotica]